MRVTMIMDQAYVGDQDGAVWIAETPENAKWFFAQTALDPQSAIFTVQMVESEPINLREVIWDIEEHFQSWSEIRIIGQSLTPSLKSDLEEEGSLLVQEGEIVLLRKTSQ